MAVSVWAPWTDGWKLSAGDDGTITLKLEGRPGSMTPVWQSLGTIKLSKDRPFKVVVAYPEEPKKSASSEKGKKRPPPPRPVPALLRLASRINRDTIPEVSLHIVRGQIDSIEPSPDRRRFEVRTNYQGADFQAPRSADAWRNRATHLREQMLVTLGLWPMFPRTPMNPRVYGKLKRDGYTIEKVVLETFPGFTLSGNLYRPAEAKGKVPGLLCPHGHWDDGRVNPEVQQRCIRWAKLGCVVFLYDMVGYNDSKPFTHAFLDDHLRRWGLSLPTLQTWNSIRALDWLTSLPDVDVARIGCTGESGGGTQTFLLTALDDRIKVAAPVVMVSDTFQGGCVCENAAGLRHGTDNVEFAAMCARAHGPRGRHRRLDQDDDGASLSRDPRRLLAGRLDRPRRRAGLRLPAQLQRDHPQRRLCGHGPLAPGHRGPGPDPRGQAADREARRSLHVRHRPSGTVEPEDARAARGVPDRDAATSARRARPLGRRGAMGGRSPAAADEPAGPDRDRQPAARLA